MFRRSFWSWSDNSQSEHWNPPLNVRDIVSLIWRVPVSLAEMTWFMFRQLTSKKFRMEVARTYNQAMFGNIPTGQIHVIDKQTGHYRPLREEERTWPE